MYKDECFNAKCKKKLAGNFIVINFGGIVDSAKVTDVDEHILLNKNIEAFMYVNCHSYNEDPKEEGPFGGEDLYEVSQIKSGSQAESIFCCKQCLFDWFRRKLKDLPNPGNIDRK